MVAPRTSDEVLSGDGHPQFPLGIRAAFTAVAACVANTAGLLLHGRVHLSAEHVGMRVSFADGTSARVYRETVVDTGVPGDPCSLVVDFRLRFVRGPGHALFRWESLLNTPLFVGFPGFVSKLWLTHDEGGRYRGIYEWDGPRRAEHYARALWRVLALVCVRGSIHYLIVPGLRRDALIETSVPRRDASGVDKDVWWLPVQTC
jgi:hypothetical protein